VVGTWLLMKDINRAPDGNEMSFFGSKPMGQIIFLTCPNSPPITECRVHPRNTRPSARAALPLLEATTSAPTERVYGCSTYPNWNGIEQTRDLSIKGDIFSYKVKASVGGVSELAYRRLK
jgi:hypothetical protein